MDQLNSIGKAFELLRLLNDHESTRDLIHSLAVFLQEWTGCEAVAIRLRQGNNFPYYETRGFPAKFLCAEDGQCASNCTTAVMKDASGAAVLDCMCSNILRGRFDATQPFFTAKGNFWTNSTTKLLAGATEDRPPGSGTQPLQPGRLRIGRPDRATAR